MVVFFLLSLAKAAMQLPSAAMDLLMVLLLLCLVVVIDQLVLMSHQACLHLAASLEEERLVSRG